MTKVGQPTELLVELRNGNSAAANRLLPLVYEQLRALAADFLRQERPGHTLQPTALVHEAYLRLIDMSRIDWQGRAHFFAVAAGLIRRILVDHARTRNALKRGGGAKMVPVDDALTPDAPGIDLLDLDASLERLRALDERQCAVVELRFFGGLTVEEVAQVLGVSPRTVKGEWALARAWLANDLDR